MVQLGSVKDPIQPYENRLSNEEPVEFVDVVVGWERAPALKPNERRLLRCISNMYYRAGR